MDKENVSPNVSYNLNQASENGSTKLPNPDELDQFQWNDVNKLFNFENSDYIAQLDQQLTQTRSQRVRAALYPESNEAINSTNAIPSTQFDPNKPTAVQSLAECSQVIWLINLENQTN